MTRIMIRVDAELSDEVGGAFPHLSLRHHRAQTTLVGQLTDQEELQGILQLLATWQIPIVDVLTIPEE